jgi:diaminopimelate decarboxylase
VREVAAAGFGASAVSAGELALAARAGLPRGQTALEGIGKAEREVRAAVTAARTGDPLLWVSIESADEARALATAASRGRTTLDLLIRLNPAVRPETHAGLAVGGSASKFGVGADEIAEVVEAGGGADGPLRWRGIHVHVGSQLGAVDAWRAGVRSGLAAFRLHRAGLPDFDTLDVGGGFPVAADEPVPGPERFAEEARLVLEDAPADTRPSRLAIEPGRFPIAASGWLVASVLHARARDEAAVVLDAGMTELIRPALYGARHPIVALTSLGRRWDGATDTRATLVDGPVCESTDRLGTADLPALRRGDVVAIGGAGAYASSMASTYNGRPRPPELAWDGEDVSLLRRRGSVAALP